MKSQRRELKALQAELSEQTWLANVGELAGPLAHEFNNILNTILLHVAVLELEVPDKLRTDLAEIRKQAADITVLIKHLRQYRKQQPRTQHPIDLNQVATEVATELEQTRFDPSNTDATSVVLDLASGLPAVLGQATDLKRLCTFLLRIAQSACPSPGQIQIRTEQVDNSVCLHLNVSGLPVAGEILPHYFESGDTYAGGTCSLELAACRAIVHRLQGQITCENCHGKGPSLTVKLKAVAP